MTNLASHFRQAALENPGKIALSMEDREVTYQELSSMAQALQRVLPRQARIGLLAHRSTTAYAGVQAILASGAAFVPLHPTSPAHHNLLVSRMADFTTLVVGPECSDAFEALLKVHEGPLDVVTLGPVDRVRAALSGRAGTSLVEAMEDPAAPLLEPVEPFDQTAYILFTSGSTGTPKGVRVLHQNVECYLEGFLQAYPLRADDRVSQVFDLTFDPSVHDQLVTWKSRATLVVFPDKQLLAPIDYAASHGVTVWFSVPSVPVFLESFVIARENSLPKIRLSLFGGEKFTWNALQIWKKIAPNSEVSNLYGLTETTIAITGFPIPADYPESSCHQGTIPVGKLFKDQSYEIRRPDGSLCGIREEGMLWFSGSQITPGYLDPAKTAEAYVERDGVIWYRSGDIVFEDESADLHYVGRDDLQVKVMGYRVELCEIEAALLRETGAAFALADVLRGGVDEIVCVLPTSCKPHKKAIREALKATLPPFLVPRIWKFQDQLPRNSNGKIDRGALRAQWAAQANEN